MNETIIAQQGVMTFDKPYEIRPNGIFFRNTNCGMTFVGKGRGDLETLLTIQDTLNLAYQYGFSHGSHAQMTMMNNKQK